MSPAGWQVTLCDPIWHVSSSSGVVRVAQTAAVAAYASLPYPTLHTRYCKLFHTLTTLERNEYFHCSGKALCDN